MNASTKKLVSIILYTVGFSTFGSLSNSAPSITSVDISELGNKIVTVKGNGFGNGPKIELIEDFEHSNASTGAPVATNKSKTGSWSSGANLPKYDDFSLSGNYSATMWDNNLNTTLRLRHDFSSPIQSVYLSYWVTIPPGYPFPGNDNAHGGFSSDSS